MALSKSVEDSLKEANSNLRNALAYAARQERPMVCREIAKIICDIQTLQDTDSILDKLESRNPGDSGIFGSVSWRVCISQIIFAISLHTMGRSCLAAYARAFLRLEFASFNDSSTDLDSAITWFFQGIFQGVSVEDQQV